MRFILAFILLFISANADLYKQGEKLYFEKGCNGCHGINAQGLNKYPYLANRAKGFLTYKLNLYKNGDISSQQALLMTPFAENLNESQIDALTTFLNKFINKSEGEAYDDSFSTEGDGGS
ncbi:MAG: c-type cytochrome [Helicobacteraceae bacterium]|nr:c-type cytochrome [Helicobacteraceae bacterium]